MIVNMLTLNLRRKWFAGVCRCDPVCRWTFSFRSTGPLPECDVRTPAAVGEMCSYTLTESEGKSVTILLVRDYLSLTRAIYLQDSVFVFMIIFREIFVSKTRICLGQITLFVLVCINTNNVVLLGSL